MENRKGSMKDKLLRIVFPNGQAYALDPAVVARHRAEHYHSRYIQGGQMNEEDRYENVFEETMNSEYEAIDWLVFNMNWSDVNPYTTELPPELQEESEQQMFLESKVDVIDK